MYNSMNRLKIALPGRISCLCSQQGKRLDIPKWRGPNIVPRHLDAEEAVLLLETWSHGEVYCKQSHV